ncbi:type II toxin-antitoxin system VapC family toxin [Chitinophaga japonensis]|uniref:Ribonuclease VapC n=1 Tax=Chitinophaga japonensis TaxID=104662 RepID=A0A562TCG3_CHIJA|nr:PIN domain nuclease [Chitinophaga japonensis]TWI91247.1 hypothetical protein LX66_0612 [Chitinophaga japonensis]
MSAPLLFDTSVWIAFFHNSKETAETGLLAQYIDDNHPIHLTPTILQEILQGIKDDAHFKKIKELLSWFNMLELDPTQAAIGAATLYRSLRKKGATVRKSNDVLIAFYAITFNIRLVHLDRDFELISQHTGLKCRKP